jgi:hypothetical protein
VSAAKGCNERALGSKQANAASAKHKQRWHQVVFAIMRMLPIRLPSFSCKGAHHAIKALAQAAATASPTVTCCVAQQFPCLQNRIPLHLLADVGTGRFRPLPQWLRYSIPGASRQCCTPSEAVQASLLYPNNRHYHDSAAFLLRIGNDMPRQELLDSSAFFASKIDKEKHDEGFKQ